MLLSQLMIDTRMRCIKMGVAKVDYSYWKTVEGIEVIGQWKRNGLTNQDICDKIGINQATLYRWQNDNESLRDILKFTRDIADTRVENALYEQCLKGNMQAIYFYLKNRKSADYKDRQEIALDSVREEAVSSIKTLVEIVKK